MANIRLIKNRIKSAKNIAQITKAMEMVAASKMRKAQAAAQAGKLYAQKIHDMVFSLAARTDSANHPLLGAGNAKSGKKLVILISTNKGLCGGLNTNLFRALIKEFYPNLDNLSFVSLGKKGTNFLSQMHAALAADFSEKVPFVQSVPALTQLLTEEFLAGRVMGVDIVYNEFVSILKQEPRKKTILPLTLEGVSVAPKGPEFMIEPSIAEVFEALLPHYLENQVRDAVLQAAASEHSAQMIAMRNATDNALSFMEDLTLLYNKARQEKITYEISDMVTARLATE